MYPFSKSKNNSAILARWILGTIFLLAGVNSLVDFLPTPKLSSEGAQFIDALHNSHYLFVSVKIIETASALMLLFNFFVPAALVLIAPIVLNIIMFGLFLSPSTLPIALIVTALHTYLVWSYKDLFVLFFKYQLYSDPLREETAHLVVLEELKEKYPYKFDDITLDGMSFLYKQKSLNKGA